MKYACRFLLCGLVLLAASTSVVSAGGHLWWSKTANGKPLSKITVLYGEIEVLASGPTIYYCGINWQPGRPAGGYCGIQDHRNGTRWVIFSVWDTSPTLHPRVTQADPRTKYNRFGHEGSGSHTHMVYPWKVGEVFRYAVIKRPDPTGANTLTSYCFFDRTRRGPNGAEGQWVLEATISSPTDNKDCVRYFGGGMNSFLENWSGRQREVVKLCLYRLWAGTSPRDLHFLRRATGDGAWGILNDSYYLGEGEAAALRAVIEKHARPGSYTVIGPKRGAKLKPISDRPVPNDVVAALERLLSNR